MPKHRTYKEGLREGVLRERHRAAAVAYTYRPAKHARGNHGPLIAKKILAAGDKIPEADYTPDTNTWTQEKFRRIPGWSQEPVWGKESVLGAGLRVEKTDPPTVVLQTQTGQFRLQVPARLAALAARWPNKILRVTLEALEDKRVEKYVKKKSRR